MFTRTFQYIIPNNFYDCWLRLDAAKTNQFKWRISNRQYAIQIDSTNQANEKKLKVFYDSFGKKLLRFECEIKEIDAQSTMLEGWFVIQKDDWITYTVFGILLIASMIFTLWFYTSIVLLSAIAYWYTQTRDNQRLLKIIRDVMVRE